MRLMSGRLVLIFNDSATVRRPLSIALSADEGRTWTASKIVADGESDYDYPTAVQTSDGLLHILYTRGRQTIQHVTLNEAWIAER